MNKGVLTLAVAALTTFNAGAVTFHDEDKALLEALAPYGISQKNWDAQEYASMNYIDTQKFSEHAKIYPGKKGRNFEKSAKSLNMDSVQVQDINGMSLTLTELLRDRLHNRTMVVLQDGKLVHEHYWSGTDKNTINMTQSAGKSFTSSLIAIAEAEGYLKLTDPVEKYVPEAKGTVLGKYPIQYVADMRSGFALIDDIQNEYGSDWDTSMEDAISWHGHTDSPWVGIADYTPHLTKLSYEQGKKYEYHSYNTELLGLITARATGKHWTEYFEDKIWKAGQFNSPTTIFVDKETHPITSGAMQMTTRDFATMGDIWAHGGKNQKGEQVVPAEWLANTMKGNDEVKLAWAKGKESALAEGWYENQFRVLNLGGENWLLAVGVNGQIIAMEPESKTVIAMFSSYNVPSSPRMAVGFFHTAIPAIKAAIK
ncbi:serine hydrolase domain-containing protein [Photobacterium kagoshimensis]|uniref:serine hydrolase domain-containing protein n=1 Tax=Photobacterium kagoshimensis TaxID=2910242 RepID=UPI003D13C83F